MSRDPPSHCTTRARFGAMTCRSGPEPSSDGSTDAGRNFETRGGGVVSPHHRIPSVLLRMRAAAHAPSFPFIRALRVWRFVLPRSDGPPPKGLRLPIMTEGPCGSEKPMMSQFQLVHLGHSHGPAGSITDLHASAPLPFALHWGLVAGETGGTSGGTTRTVDVG